MNCLNKIENFFLIEIPQYVNKPLKNKPLESPPKPTPLNIPNSQLLPPFKKYITKDIKFEEFKPVKNLYYLFFSDNNEPTTSIPSSVTSICKNSFINESYI